METIKNNLCVIAFAIISIVALHNSQAAMMLTSGTGDIYIAALNSDAYEPICQAFSTVQPVVF